MVAGPLELCISREGQKPAREGEHRNDDVVKAVAKPSRVPLPERVSTSRVESET